MSDHPVAPRASHAKRALEASVSPSEQPREQEQASTPLEASTQAPAASTQAPVASTQAPAAASEETTGTAAGPITNDATDAPSAAASGATASPSETTSAAGIHAAENVDFEALLRDVLEHPERILKENLTPEQVLEIQKRLNPYAGIASTTKAPDHVRVAACSYTNLRESYIRRLTMTSLVGFLFQMLHEWEVPAASRRWTPVKKNKNKDKDDPACQPWDAADLVAKLEAIVAVAQESRDAAAASAAALQAANDAELCAEKPEDVARAASVAAEQRASAAALAAKAAGLLYAATRTLQKAGLDADRRLESTAAQGMQHAEVKKILERFPPPSQLEVPAGVAADIIGGFLRHWFEFDPSVHVRSGYDAKTMEAAVEKVLVGTPPGAAVLNDALDPSHLPLEAVRAAAPPPSDEDRGAVETIMESSRSYAAVAALLRDERLTDAALAAIQKPDAFKQYLFPVPPGDAARRAADTIPPQDTFHRWGYYTEVNYEALRTITEAIYPERVDLDWGLALWETFEGTQKEVDKAFQAYCLRYQDEVPSSIMAIEFGQWSLLADFKQNRDKINFYNKHTAVLERILDRHAADKRIGAELMRNRVRQAKAQNIATDGPDAPGLKDYRRAQSESGADLSTKGVERVIGIEEMKRLEKARGNLKAARELELLEQLEKIIADLGALQKTRALTPDEQVELTRATKDAERSREMLAVPDDAIQVDVFTNDAKTGTFGKTHFYTKAEAPEQFAAARREHEASRADQSQHPVVAASASSAAGTAPLAPYAAEHQAHAEKRTQAEMKAEAEADVAARD